MPAIRAQMPVVHAFKSNMVAQVSPCPAQNLACPAYMYTGAAQNSEPAALTVPTATLTAGTVAQDFHPATLTVLAATLAVGSVASIYSLICIGGIFI